MQCVSCQKSTVNQVAVVLVANLPMMLAGMALAFPSAMLGPLLDTDSPGFHASVNESSWIASIVSIFAPIGCLLAGPIVDKLGRRRGIQLLYLPHIVGWVLLALVPYPFRSIYPLFVGRTLTALSAGVAYGACPTYTAEVVSPALRTRLVSVTPIMLGIGIVSVDLLADIYRDQWITAACVAGGISFLSTLVSIFLPETPVWLLTRNDRQQASNSLMVLRGSSFTHEVEQELKQMEDGLASKSLKLTWKALFQNVSKPEAYKPLIIMNMYFMFQQFSGTTMIIVYGPKIAEDAEIYEGAYTVALFIGVARMIATFVTTWACGRWGRRIVASTTGVAMTLSMFCLSAYIYLRHSRPDVVPATPLIPAVCFIAFVFTNAIGFSTLPMSMLGEMYPTNVRGLFSGLTTSNIYFMSFFAVKFFPIAVAAIGNVPVFTFLTVTSCLGTIYVAIFLPETHGKSLPEIEEYFRGSKNAKESNLGNSA